MYYGASEAKLRKVLGHVRALGDAMVFIDEAESFFPARGKFVGSHNTDNKVGESSLFQRTNLKGPAFVTPSLALLCMAPVAAAVPNVDLHGGCQWLGVWDHGMPCCQSAHASED